MRVPAAFRTAPSVDLGERSGGRCACGSDMNRTYIVATVVDGGNGKGAARRRRRHVATPVLWCQRCRRLGSTHPIGGQEEVRGPNFSLLCAHCRRAMYRMFVTHGTAGEAAAIPLSYCTQCASVSFRAIADAGRTRGCDLCGREVPACNRWCGGCKRIVDGWRRRHGPVPPSGDTRFADVMRMVVEEAARTGRSRSAGMRVCTSCRAEFARSAPRQRRCGDCVAGQLYRGRRRGWKAVAAAAAAAAVKADAEADAAGCDGGGEPAVRAETAVAAT